MLPSIFLIVAVAAALLAALIDWRTGQIPNWLTLGLLAVAPFAHALVDGKKGGMSAAAVAFGFSVLGAAICGLAPLLIWMAGGGGGGDLKIFAALGALLGTNVGLEAEMYAFIGASLYSLAWMAYQGKLFQTLGRTATLLINPFLPAAKRRPLPEAMMTELRFGPSILLGTLLAAFLNWKG